VRNETRSTVLYKVVLEGAFHLFMI